MVFNKIKRILYRLWYKKPINIDKHNSWYQWLKTNWQKDNMFPPPIEPELALCYLADYLLDIKTTPEDIDVYNIALKITKKYLDKPIKIVKTFLPYQIMNKLFEAMLLETNLSGYIVNPITQWQVHTEIVSGILQEYSDDYNEEYEYYMGEKIK